MKEKYQHVVIISSIERRNDENNRSEISAMKMKKMKKRKRRQRKGVMAAAWREERNESVTWRKRGERKRK